MATISSPTGWWQQVRTWTHPADLRGISESQIKHALDKAQMQSLPFIYGSVTALFLGYSLIQYFFLQESGAALMTVVGLVSTLIIGVIWIVLRQNNVPSQYADRIAGFAAALVLSSMMLRFYMTADMKQTSNFVLYVVAIGVLLLSGRWFMWLTLVTILGWVIGVLFVLPDPSDWFYFGVVLGTAVVTAVVAHVARIRTYRQAEVMRITDQRQREELHRRAVQIETSSAVGQRITSILDLETLLHQVSELIRERYPGYYIGVYLHNGNGVFNTARGISHKTTDGLKPSAGYRIKVGPDGLISYVVATGKALLIPDVVIHPRYISAESLPSTKSELILPLKMGSDVLGVLDFQSDRLNEFREQDVPVFQLLADQVAIALENAQLYEETKQFNQQLEDKVRQRTAALQEAYQQLEQLDKTKSDFISITSHELRTPLTILSFNNQMLANDDAILSNEHYARWVQGISDGATRMGEIVERMLDVAKIDSASLDLNFEPVDLALLLQQVVKQFRRPLAERNMTLQQDDMRGIPKVTGDTNALWKVFYHIIINAIKYTPDGGRIRIISRAFHDHKRQGAQYVEVVIQDTGIGIAPDVHQLIFKKFYQTGEVMLHSSGRTSFKGGGAGLGLAIAKGIIDEHHGRIWVESDRHDEESMPGSRFFVVLPVEQPLKSEDKK